MTGAVTRRAYELLFGALLDRGFALEKARRLLSLALAVPLFRGCERGVLLSATGYVRVRNQGRIVLGDRVTFTGGMISTHLACGPGALLEIGSESLLNYGVSIEATRSVRVGARCLIASMVRITDATGRGEPLPVVLGDDVWVAHGAIVEPGVTIGAHSVIGAGAVVTSDVPAEMLAIGNPARCMRLEMAGRQTSA